MKKKFTFKSAYYFTIAMVGAAAVVLLPVIAAVSLGSTVTGLIVLVFALALHISSLHLAACVPCSISADDNELRVRVLFRKYVFPYQDIESVAVGHEFVETQLYEQDPCFNAGGRQTSPLRGRQITGDKELYRTADQWRRKVKFIPFTMIGHSEYTLWY